MLIGQFSLGLMEAKRLQHKQEVCVIRDIHQLSLKADGPQGGAGLQRHSLELSRIMAFRQTYSSRCSFSSRNREVAASSMSKISMMPSTHCPSSLQRHRDQREKTNRQRGQKEDRGGLKVEQEDRGEPGDMEEDRGGPEDMEENRGEPEDEEEDREEPGDEEEDKGGLRDEQEDIGGRRDKQ